MNYPINHIIIIDTQRNIIHCCYTKKIINDSSVNIEMTTDGFKRIDSSLKYKRIISITDNFFKVTDCFSAKIPFFEELFPFS